jgi:hypothetical protein
MQDSYEMQRVMRVTRRVPVVVRELPIPGL